MRKDRPLIYLLARNAAGIAAAFLLLLTALVVSEQRRNHVLLLEADAVLTTMREQVKSLPDDEAALKVVRDLDYLYRDGYFSNERRLRLGIGLGISALLILAVCAVAMTLSAPVELKRPADDSKERSLQLRRLQLATAASVALLLCLGLLAWRATRQNAATAVGDAMGEVGGAGELGTVAVLVATPTIAVPAAAPPLALPAALAAGAGHWPGFRGSLVPNANRLPPHFRLQRAWASKVPLAGYNSPVVWGDRIFVSGADRRERAIFCFSLADGALLWRVAAGAPAVVPEVTADTGYAAPTMAVDGQRAYAVFATGQVLCTDHEGAVLWERSLPEPKILYGYASSLLLAGPDLIVQYDMEEEQTLYCLDVTTGKDRWATPWQAASSWSSPVLLADEQRQVIFVAGNRKAGGFDLASGRLLWENSGMGGEVACSAVAADGTFYFANSGALAAAFAADSGEILWRNDNVPMPDVASPVVAAGVMYLFTSGGSVITLDAKNGEELYEENFDNGFYASPVLVDGRIVAVNMDGLLLVVEPSRESFKVVGRYEIGKKVLATPAFAQQRLIIRSMDNELVCLEAANGP